MSFGLNEQARIPVIIDGEEPSQEENETKDDSDEDDLDSKEVSFHQWLCKPFKDKKGGESV